MEILVTGDARVERITWSRSGWKCSECAASGNAATGEAMETGAGSRGPATGEAAGHRAPQVSAESHDASLGPWRLDTLPAQ